MNIDQSWRTDIYLTQDPIQIEVTFADQSTQTVTLTGASFTYVGTYNSRATSTTGTVSFDGCTADWEGTWPIGANDWQYDATQANGTFTYGNFHQ